MEPDEIKDTLMMELAKTILDRSVSSTDKPFSTTLTISAILIPVYTTIVAFFVKSGVVAYYGVVLAPNALWLASLIICGCYIFPREVLFDLQDVPSIIETYAKDISRSKRWGRTAIVFLIAGVICAVGVILYLGNQLPINKFIQAP